MRPIAVSGLGATAEETQEAELRANAQETRVKYDYYMALAPNDKHGNPGLPADRDGNVSAEDAIEWGKQALENYERSTGVKSSSSFRTKIATANSFRGLNLEQGNVGAAAQILGDISGAAGNQYYSVSAEAAVMTASQLRDGKITEAEAAEMGTAIGAVVGAAVCQSVGVPAPIGAVVGGYVGGGSAEIIHNVFAGPSEEKLQKAREARVRQVINHFRFDAVAACDRFRLDYWKQVDEFVKAFAVGWTDAERSIGWRFGLRWFEPTDDAAFRYKWDKQKMRADTSRGIRRDTKAAYDCQSVQLSTTKGTQHTEWCTSRCTKVYGCPYPDLYQGVSGGPTPTHVVPGALEQGIRVMHALAARGVVWLPPRKQRQGDWMRPLCEEYIPQVPSDAYQPANQYLRERYRDNVRTLLANLDDQYRKFARARTWLMADLTRTIAVVGSEHNLWINKARYIEDGATGGAVRKARKQSKQLSNIVTGVSLTAGVALLGYAVYRGTQ